MLNPYQPNPANPGGTFGASAPLFGQNSGFGTAPPTNTGFGAPTSSFGTQPGAFGAQPGAFGASSFGMAKPGLGTTPATGGLFGAAGGQKMGFGTGAFGAAPNPAFSGAAATSSFGAGTFGQQSVGGSLFAKPGAAFGGSGTTGAFGAPNTFGQQPSQQGFGGQMTGGFGPQTQGFGAPTPNTFGAGFGGTTNQTFGGNPAFGAPAPTTTGFGGSQPTPGGFGPAAGAFAPQPSNPSPFGATTGQAPLFGAPTSGGLFGPSTMGNPTPGFGPPAAQPFGAPTSTFGTTTGFGAASGSNPTMLTPGNAPPGAGTLQVKHVPTQLQEAGSMGQMLNITAMQAYMNKSVEELRLEDYQYNNVRQKLASGGMTQPSGLMTSLSAPQPASTGTSFFPGPTSAPAAPASTSLFGNSTGGLFSQANPSAPTTGLFGADLSKSSPFGASAATPTFGAQAGQSLFGPSQQQQGKQGLFGSAAPTTGTGLFAPGTSGTQPASTSIFGGNQQGTATGGLFGSNTGAGMGTGIGTGGLFNSQPATAGGLFGNSGGQSSFGMGATGASSYGAGSFGMKPPGSPSLFGGNQQSQGLYANAQPMGMQNMMGSQDGSMMAGYKDPFGMGWLFPQGMPEDVLTLQRRNSDKATNLEPTSALERALKHGKTSVRKAVYTGTLSDSWSQSSLRKSSLPRRPPLFSPANSLRNDPAMFACRKSFSSLHFESSSDSEDPLFRMRGSIPPTSASDFGTIEVRVVGLSEEPAKLLVKISKQSTIKELKEKICCVLTTLKRDQMQLIHRGNRLRESDFIRDLHLSNGDEVYFLIETEARSVQKALAPKEILPKLTMAGYVTTPSMIELARMSTEELANIRNFTVENSFGRIEFLGQTDLRELDLDSILSIEDKAVIMYPDKKGIPKPVVGKGLNKPARIRLYDCRPKKEIPPELFVEKIKKVCEKNGTTFESYDPETGEWVFRASHF